ncbi:MAG: alkaline phosphatase family protein [Bryobacteraceae bacterium]
MALSRRAFGAAMAGALTGAGRAIPRRPQLTVCILLEHFQPDLVDSAWERFSPGGFRRLLERGSYFPDCRHLASTFSSTTLATLATGAWPAQHGIVADWCYDRAIRKPVRLGYEDLFATTLAAQVAAQDRARVTVVALDPLHARLVTAGASAGRFWMDDNGRFAASGSPPDWLDSFNQSHSPDALHDARWMAQGARPETPPLRVLRYDAAHPKEFLELYRASPFAQNAQFELAYEVIARASLGQNGIFDLLYLVVSSSALLGYETGSQSPLLQQMILRLDRDLASLLDRLSHEFGDAGFSLIVAGGHGAPPLPSDAARPRMAVNGESVAQTIEKALALAKLGHVATYLYPFVYLDPDPATNLDAVRDHAAAAAMNYPAVAAAFTASGACSVHDQWEERFRNSFHPKRSGDLMLSYRPEYVEDYGQKRGISYGSIYNYDVRTPLCLYGPQFLAGVFEQPIEAVDLAPTLARTIGVASPSSAAGRVLSEALIE